jgi:hypothetical protein
MPPTPLMSTFARMEIDHCPGIESFVDLFASKNFRISLVEDHQFCKFLHEANLHIKMPTASELHAAIIDRADRIRSALTPENEGS